MLLFPDKIRTDYTYARPNERIYTFLNRSGLEESGLVRKKLNAWFGHYPEPEQNELKKRMQSKEHFSDAFFELYMHEFFYDKGFQLSVHPQLESTGKRPDFWVTKGKELSFYLEAKVVHDVSDCEREYKEKQDKIADELNNLANFPWWIAIQQLQIKNESSFSVKPVIKKIQETVKTFDYLQMLELTTRESLSFEDENVQIELALWPRVSSRIEGINPAVGVFDYFDAKFVNTSGALSKAIEEKARRYGKQKFPFVIALNCKSPHHFTFFDLEQVLGPDIKHTRSNNPMNLTDRASNAKGIFSHHFMDQVAALIFTWVTLYHQDDELWYWCENPNFGDKNFQEYLINQIF
ncbi:MAG: hypothetical protein JNL22_14125 [Bacteroidales bacterium]|nr:hypothetical protein [Bacteroidales bacterium]